MSCFIQLESFFSKERNNGFLKFFDKVIRLLATSKNKQVMEYKLVASSLNIDNLSDSATIFLGLYRWQNLQACQYHRTFTSHYHRRGCLLSQSQSSHWFCFITQTFLDIKHSCILITNRSKVNGKINLWSSTSV